MSTTTKPPADEPQAPEIQPPEETDGITATTEGDETVVRVKFRTRILGRLKAAYRHAKHYVKAAGSGIARGAKATGHGVAVGAKATWHGICWGADRTLWAFAGALNIVATGIYLLGRYLVLGVTWAVMAVVAALIFVISCLAFAVVYLFYAVMKVVHFVALVIASPWIALHSKKALKEDWEIFFTGLKPKNFHVLHPMALAAATLREREQRAAERAEAGEDDDGKSSRSRTAPKGRPTARQHRGGVRMGPVVAAATV